MEFAQGGAELKAPAKWDWNWDFRHGRRFEKGPEGGEDLTLDMAVEKNASPPKHHSEDSDIHRNPPPENQVTHSFSSPNMVTQSKAISPGVSTKPFGSHRGRSLRRKDSKYIQSRCL